MSAHLTIREAQKRSGCSRSTLYDYAHRGIIPAVRRGSRILFPVEEFEKWNKGVPLCQGISTSAAKSIGGASPPPAASIDEAYERAIGLKPKSGSRRGRMKSLTPPSLESRG